jgi:hypothetical protein
MLNPCPCCDGNLKVRGSKKRKRITSEGKKLTLQIRVLKCLDCKRIHHELPDIIVPYKRYDRESIEAVITGGTILEVAVSADESTINRWKKWFTTMSYHFIGCLISIAIKYNKVSAKYLSELPKSVLQRIFHFVGNAPAWLARVVRSVVNSNNWAHTRSAFMSKDE